MQFIGIIILVFKFSYSAPSQSEFNNLIAEAVLANTHTVATFYQIARKDVPTLAPDYMTIPEEFQKKPQLQKIPELVFPEIDRYIRKASKSVAKYFGHNISKCKIKGLDLSVISLAPDAEIVNFEISRLSKEKHINCEEDILSIGLAARLLDSAVQNRDLDFYGILLVLFSFSLKFLELQEDRKKRAIHNFKSAWYWDEEYLN